jgi:small subunit ribosomal protein S1
LNAEQRNRLGSIEAGTTIEGRVTRIADFGAFVEVVEDVEGLCHVSEMSWTSRISHPSEVLSEGDVVKMKILAVDAESGRVSLSLRALEDNPWASIEKDFPAGSVAAGVITRVEDYGLFVKVAEGVEGLCHIGDLTWVGRPDRPSDVSDYAVGDSLEVKVLSIDVSRSRISLGVKQLSGDPWDDAGDKTTVGTIFTAEVVRFDDQSAFLKICEGLDARMHISEISEERIDSIRAALRIGQEVEVMTIRADRDRRRLDISVKAVAAKIEAETPKSYEDKASMNPMAAALAASGLASGGSDDAATAAAAPAAEAVVAEAPAAEAVVAEAAVAEPMPAEAPAEAAVVESVPAAAPAEEAVPAEVAAAASEVEPTESVEEESSDADEVAEGSEQ